MSLKFNPLLRGGFDESKRILDDLEDVNTAGTVNGKVLTFQSGTWIPETAAGGGDMLISQYVTGQGTVYNASRLAGETLATVQAHGVDAGTITQGTIGLARVPAMDDAHIPNLETLSYGGTFAEGQIPNLPTSKITTGTFNANRIPALPTSRITTGTFDLNRVPSIDDAHIPNLDTLSGGAFGTAQIPSIGAYKITSGTLGVARHETLDNLNGTVDLVQIPTMDDGHIPDLETLSYGGTFADAQIPNAELLSYGAAFGTAQIPSIGAYKVTSGTLNADRIPALPTARITSGTFNADRIPILPTNRYGSAVLVSGTRSLTGDLDFAKHQAKAMALEALGSAPASPATAQMYYNTGDDKVYVYVV